MYSTSSAKWATRNQPGMDFNRLTRRSLKDIRRIRSELAQIYQTFGDQQRLVYPKECDLAANAFQALQKTANQICMLLNNSQSIQMGNPHVRYPALLSLRYIDQQVDEIIPVLGEFRNECLEPSRTTARLQRRISEVIKESIEVIDQLTLDPRSL